jgi:hypothetical protein
MVCTSRPKSRSAGVPAPTVFAIGALLVVGALGGCATERTSVGSEAPPAVSVMSTPDAPAVPLSNGCDPAAIVRDLGPGATAVRCYGQWAYISLGELGDSQLLARQTGGVWSNYTGFPSSKCSAQAAADGVPPAELSSFQPC